ncbi:hypothetical protein D8674_000980 [Pyrus ussuriensis x Pyrus communis]|uniref:Uncharacterized protein n=1 Tax=Pyrus ussuriensis x Pyrus communis TaxID=2448454 RepID=A0A5N5FAB0_9ROSA|nr:hypothetical protein D8674_000980 [Pyrus ussuriensis x Pyrus communis]
MFPRAALHHFGSFAPSTISPKKSPPSSLSNSSCVVPPALSSAAIKESAGEEEVAIKLSSLAEKDALMRSDKSMVGRETCFEISHLQRGARGPPGRVPEPDGGEIQVAAHFR